MYKMQGPFHWFMALLSLVNITAPLGLGALFMVLGTGNAASAAVNVAEEAKHADPVGASKCSETDTACMVKVLTEQLAREHEANARQQEQMAQQQETIDSLQATSVRPGSFCGFPEPTVENYLKLDVEGFLKREFQIFQAQQVNQSFVADYFVPKFFNKATPAVAACDMAQFCIIDCDQATDFDPNNKDSSRAWLAMTQIINFHTLGLVTRDALRDAFVELAADRAKFASDIFAEELTRSIVSAAVLVVMAALPLAAPASLATMGLAAEASAGVKAAFTMGQNIVSLVGTAYIGVNGVTNAAVAEVYRNRNPDNLIKGIEDLLGHEFAEMFWTALGNLEGNTLKLLRGERLEDGIDLSTVLAGGLFVGKMDLDVVDVREKAKTIFAGMGINALWNLDSTYMVGSETQGGSCDNDQRGPSWLKICDPADMSKVYYIYRLSFAWDDVPEFSQAMAPAGSLRYMNGTGGYHGITLQDAALASIRYYNQFGNARPGTSEVANPPDVNAFTLQNQVLDDSVSHMLDGIFTIPVCWNAGGEFISSDAIDDARNYPCMCGDKPIHHEDNTFRPDLDKTGQFLIASRIELLNDWRAYCNHNMDCIWGDMAVAFQDIWPTFIGDGFSPVDGYMAKQFTKCSNCKCHGKMGKVDGEMQYAYDTERPDC